MRFIVKRAILVEN